MQNKFALCYNRFSNKDQSHGSIERQDMINRTWCRNNNITITDTFNDDGHSAKNFDRPDIKKLFEFIRNNRTKIDYLVVAELTRFSRELGDAINMVTTIQKQHGIKIVSSGRNSIYDVKDPTSFFMMSIEFTLGNTENLKREHDINGGIYTAKKEGRYIGSRPPFGYTKEGAGKDRKLVPLEEEAAVVRYIFHEYLAQTPIAEIKKKVHKMDFKPRGNSCIHDVLTNPIYSGQQLVKAWKDQPGGVLPANHDGIIDMLTWTTTQLRLQKPKRAAISISDEMPLKGVMHCHCGTLLTGAPSRSRNGNYYYYYKCRISSKHNNISVPKVHDQMQQILQHLSLPAHIIAAVKDQSRKDLDTQLKAQTKELMQLRRQQEQNEEDLIQLEQKWIRNQVNFETYQRWFSDYTTQRSYLSAKIDSMSRTGQETHMLLQDNLHQLGDMQHVYNAADTSEKQQLLRKVFEQSLSYRDNIVRTGYLMNIFKHNALILNQKKLLIIEEKPDFGSEIRCGGAHRSLIEPITDLLQIISSIKVA